MILKIIAIPLIGGIIGYITNDIAVKMLFRPREAHYIGRFHIPFTPGLIPRQRERIAAALGGIVATQLMDRDTIVSALTSKASMDSVYEMFGKMTDKWKRDERTLREGLNSYFDNETIDRFALSVQEGLTDYISQRLAEADYGKKLLEGDNGFLIHGIIRGSIAGLVNKLVNEKLPGIIFEEIGRAEENLLAMRLCDVYEKYEDKMPQLIDKLVQFYETAALKNVDRVLKIVDIERMVVEKVRAFDAEQLEKLIFGIIHRELRAIVYIGAVLGFLMGFLNLIFILI